VDFNVVMELAIGDADFGLIKKHMT